jgi:Esterase/lipase
MLSVSIPAREESIVIREHTWLGVLAATLAIGATACSSGHDAPRAKASADSSTPSSNRSCATPGQATTVAYTTVPGIDANLTSLDIHAPPGACTAPIVMWVHGGGYRIGDKTNQVRNKVNLFNLHGWVFVSVNYRLTRPGVAGSARFPDHYNDVAAAVAWVHANIASYGGDPARIALLGHSAGADIVSNVADNPEYLAQHGVGLDALVCAGPLDTEGFDKAKASAQDPGGEKAQWRTALGTNPNYVTATSATRLIKPNIGIPPTIGVVRGTAQRQAIETEYLATLQTAGVRTVSIDARTLTHAQVNREIGTPGDTVMTTPLTEFLTTCFAS